MNAFFDAIPIIIFFIAYKVFGIYIATATAMVASLIQTLTYRIIHKRFQMMQLSVFFLITVLGGTTLILHNIIFIQWKPTIVNWVFALVFFAGQFIGKKTIPDRMMGKNISLPPAVWKRLNVSWIIFFITMGFLNLYVVYHFSTDAWVNFKLFGMLGLSILFAIFQVIYLYRFINVNETAE
jgi:intracellular septation protein